MTTYTLWSQAAETWSATGASEGTAGIEISVSVAGTLAGLWLYSPSGESLTSLPTEIALYTVSGETLVTSQTPSWSASYGTGWVFAPFSSPPALTASTDYMAVVFGAAGSFGYDSSFTWPVTSGPVTGVNGGYYNTGASLAYPSSQQSGWNWWVDVSFTVATASSPGGTPLTPPGIASPMAFRRHAYPSPAPVLVQSADTGTGADTGAVTADVSDSDTGSSTDTASFTVTGAPPPPASAVLVPPSPFTPMAFQRQAYPSGAPALATAQDTGSAVDSGQPDVTDADAGSGADTAAVTVPGADAGSGADSSYAGPPVQSFPLTPPGLASPMAFQRQRWPSPLPELASSGDLGAGADSGTVTAAVSGADTGAAAEAASAGALPGTGMPGIPPGFASPMAFRFQSWPSDAPQGAFALDTGAAAESAAVTVSGSDVGTGTEAAGGVPVTGAGITWWLNPVRESVTGLNVSLHMSTALGAILQFASTGNERLYVMASSPGVTLTVTDGGMVLDQAAQPFPPVTLQTGMLYAFGPFHSVVQVPGTSTIQVALSTTYGVQVLVAQGPGAH